MMAREDLELRAIREIMRALAVIDEKAQMRVIGYVWARYFGDGVPLNKGNSDLLDQLRLQWEKDEEDSCEG